MPESQPSTIMEAKPAKPETAANRPCAACLGDRWVALALGCVWLVLGIGLLFTGPLLNSHETYVAQIARQTLQDGHWIVPRYLDAPFLLKPPLTPWVAAVAGYILPADQLSGLPVSTAAARLPSLIAVLLTIIVVYKLGESLFGRRIGVCAAFVYATSAGTLTFAVNATAEAMLTFFCAWAYAEFWWSREAEHRRRLAHQVRFYIALSLAMMTKAPMPLMVVAVPLAVWWWLEPLTRAIADLGLREIPSAIKLFGRSLPLRTRLALTGLGVWWGIPVAFGILLLWMWAASAEVPYIWKLWQTEYINRLDDQELWSRKHGPFYYLPLLLGFTAPWLLSLLEAFASPFLSRYRQHRRGLLYAWFWAVTSLVLLGCMNFKKYYYIVPVLPPCALLLGPVMYQLFFAPSAPPKKAIVLALRIVTVLLVIGAPVASFAVSRSEAITSQMEVPFWLVAVVCAVAVVSIALAVQFYIMGRGPLSFATVGLCGMAVFSLVWIGQGLGPQIDDQDALIAGLRKAGVDDSADLYWADSVPDGRLTFYCNRRVRQLGDTIELRAGLRGEDKDTTILSMAGTICKMLEGERVYVVFRREKYNTLTSFSRPKGKILFEVDRVPTGKGDEDWLVVTNK